jgi:hypothetical protein
MIEKKITYLYVDIEDPEVLVLAVSETKEADRDKGDEAIGSTS